MGFFTGIFIFLFVLAYLSLFVEYPILGIFTFLVIFLIIAVCHQNFKDTEETVKKSIDRICHELERTSFKVSREIYLTRDRAHNGLIYSELIIDSHNQQVAVCNFLKDDLRIIPFENLINCEVIENNEIVRSFASVPEKEPKLVIGGAPAKEIKSLISNLSIRIETSNPDNSVVLISLIMTSMQRASYEYKMACDVADNAYSALVDILRGYRLRTTQLHWFSNNI